MVEIPRADALCDGGDLDCGSGLLLILRDALAALPAGALLELRSRERSVAEDLPAWCRMVGHALEHIAPLDERTTCYFLRKGARDESLTVDREAARRFEWRVRVAWRRGLAASAYARNHTIAVGQPASFDTADSAPSALELLLSSLGGCLAVGFAWRASKRSITLAALEVSLSARCENVLVFLGIESGGHPGLAAVEAIAYVDADAEEAILEELWEDTVRRSPVAQTIARGAPLRAIVKRAP